VLLLALAAIAFELLTLARIR